MGSAGALGLSSSPLGKKRVALEGNGRGGGQHLGRHRRLVTWMPKGIFSPKVTAPPEVRALSNFFPPLPQPPPLFPAQVLAHDKFSTHMLYEYWKEYILYTHFFPHVIPQPGLPWGLFPSLYFMSFSSYILCSVVDPL